MPVSSWSTSASSNLTVGGVNIAENMARSDVNDAMRAIMAEAKAGFLEAPSVKGYGAVGDGTTDDTAAFTAALAAQDVLFIPKGTYKLTTALALDNKTLVGMGSDASILLFTGATDGITIDNFRVLHLEGLTIRTSNASGGKGLKLTTGSKGYVSDLVFDATGTGRWAFGIWANNWQTSNFYGVRMPYYCNVGIHLEYGCNANHFFGLEIIGYSATTRAIELDSDNSLAAGRVVFEVYFHGGTWQGAFTDSVMWSDGASPLVHSVHIENTNAAPAAGADVYLSGGIVSPRFVNMEGGSFLTNGTIRNLHIGGAVGVLTFATGCQFGLINARYESLSDADGTMTVLGGSNNVGTAVPAVICGSTVKFMDGTTVCGEINDTGLMISAAATAAGGGQVKFGSTTQTTVGAAGAASALPATPSGYLRFFVGATEYVLPYYARV